MSLQDEVAAVQREAAELQQNLQELLQHRQQRFSKWRITTFFRDAKGEQYQALTIDKHKQSVMDRAVLEGTLRSLNYKNWDSLSRASVDLVEGLYEDDRKMVLLINQFQSLSRVLRLLGAAVPQLAAREDDDSEPLQNHVVESHTLQHLELPAFDELDQADLVNDALVDAELEPDQEQEPEYDDEPEPMSAPDEDEEEDKEPLRKRRGGVE